MWADRLTFLEQRRAHDQMAFVRLGTSTAGLFAAVDATAWSFLRWHQPTSTPVMTLAGCVTATTTLRTSKKGQVMSRYFADASGTEMSDARGENPWAVTDERMHYVPCEACSGTGEIIISVGQHQCDTSSVLCSACEGYGMECVPHEPAGIEHTEELSK